MKNSTEKTSIFNINIKRIIFGLSEIGNLDIENFKLSFGITKSIASLSSSEKLYNECATSLRNEYFKKNVNNEFIMENGQFIYKENSDGCFFEKAKILDNKEVENLEIYMMRASELEKIKGIKATSMAKCHELIIDDIMNNLSENKDVEI